MGVALLGGERLEDRLEPLHGLLVAADHEAEADLEPPDPARDARVHEVDALLRRLLVPALRVAEVRVAAVDDRVAALGELQQVLEDILRDLAGRDHHPEGARRLELALQLLERAGRPRLDLGVVRADLVAALAQPLRHAVAHPAEADHPELHGYRSSSRTRATRRSRSFNDA